jgi:two-component system, chemotaxis family, chemotaxis protein CheY
VAKTMLIVDDARLARMMVRAIVANIHPDWQVIEAQDGAEALTKTATTPIDVMTVDLNRPGMDGSTFATAMREKFPGAHIALVTANIQDGVRQRAEAASIGFIPKPITADKLLVFLEQVEHSRE